MIVKSIKNGVVKTALFFLRAILGEKGLWDLQYRSGKWDYLKDPLEVKRYEAVHNAIAKYADKGYIMEVGCGEGILQSRMKPGSYEKFIGIDYSKVAIKKAAHLCNEKTEYIYADMEVYEPKEQFDAIVFNESIYYAKNPIELIRKYAQFLRPDGQMILSIYESEATRELMKAIQSAYPMREETVSKNERAAWHCQVYDRQAILATAPIHP